MTADHTTLQPTAADFIVRCLETEKVTTVFGYPGGAALHLYDALSRTTSLSHVLVRHEQGAVHAADGYSRASGKAGVCLVTSGPGVTNSVTGIATAYMDSVPLVVITAQAPLKSLGTDAFQEVDTLGITRSCVKHSFLLTRTEDIETTFKKAFHIATTGRPGPVLIDVPKDLSGIRMRREFWYPQEVEIRSYHPYLPVLQRRVQRAVQAIREAQRPLIYYGGGVVLGNASEELRALAHEISAPVTSTLMGLGAFPATHPQFLGMLGMHGTYEANLAMQHCDVLIAVGARFDDRVIGDPKDFARPARRIIHIDIDPSSISKRVAVDIPLIGDCAELLRALTMALREAPPKHHPFQHWVTEIERWRGEHCLKYPTSELIKPQQVIELLSSHPESCDMVVTSDVGQHQMWAAQYFKFVKPRKWINSGGLGTMGFGLPAAIGAAIALPDHPVVCITGDGSIQMCSKELSTCLQYGLPIKIICLNNSSLGMVRQQQDFFHDGRRTSSYMESMPDFVALAQAYGHEGVRVSASRDLEKVVRETLDKRDRLVFVDILIDRTENVYPTLAGGSGLSQMILRPQPVAEEL